MLDYTLIREHCQKSSSLSKSVIDEFLLHYTAHHDRLDREFESRISRFKNAERGMPANWYGLIKAQYIGHRIFKPGGLIRKYLNHAALKDLDSEQQNYLRQTAVYPWKFSFSQIIAKPERDFYEMEDVFSGEVYLLYSQSVTQISSEHSVLLWFNLIGFNGSCWQTYGPVGNFQCFDADDIFFYATEFNRAIESEDDLIEDVENSPVPYMMLMTGSNYPLIRNGEHEVLQVIGEHPSSGFDTKEMKKSFRVEYAEPVFRISHKIWSEPPHFAEAYYNEERGILFISALTDHGYLELTKVLNKKGFNLPGDPDIRLHLPMITVMKNLLQKDLVLNPYSVCFEKKAEPESDLLMGTLNRLLALALPYINSGQEPNVDALAKEAGVDPETAKQLLRKSMDRINKLRKK